MNKKLTTCKACGQEIAKSAKACPYCGAKNKKPIFQKWWFWVVVVVLIGSFGSAGNKADTNDSEKTNVPTEAVVSANKLETEDNKSHVEQSSVKNEEITVTEKETEPEVEMTTGQKNALRSAKNYLSFTAFSYEGLIAQLEFEKYSYDEAVFAADYCGADWNEQALKSAKNYLSFTAFSYTGLIKQLEFEKYTTEQATYAADNCGADWFEQAAKSAENYLDIMSFSKDGLIQQLEFEGFTHEQAEYGAEENGY